MLKRRHDPDTRCAITGLSRHQLRKIGEKLSVDRINPYLGYVRGNCQIIALSLNTAKGRSQYAPGSAIRWLLRRAGGVRPGRFTRPL